MIVLGHKPAKAFCVMESESIANHCVRAPSGDEAVSKALEDLDIEATGAPDAKKKKKKTKKRKTKGQKKQVSAFHGTAVSEIFL